MNQTIQFQKNRDKGEMIVTHSYKATPETLWKAFTEPEILEKWWVGGSGLAVVNEPVMRMLVVSVPVGLV